MRSGAATPGSSSSSRRPSRVCDSAGLACTVPRSAS
jgi:hypothetical protein